MINCLMPITLFKMEELYNALNDRRVRSLGADGALATTAAQKLAALTDEELNQLVNCTDDMHIGTLLMICADNNEEYLKLLDSTSDRPRLYRYLTGVDFLSGSELDLPISHIWLNIEGTSTFDRLDKYCALIDRYFFRKYQSAFYASDYVDPPNLVSSLIESEETEALLLALKKHKVTEEEFDYDQIRWWNEERLESVLAGVIETKEKMLSHVKFQTRAIGPQRARREIVRAACEALPGDDIFISFAEFRKLSAEEKNNPESVTRAYAHRKLAGDAPKKMIELSTEEIARIVELGMKRLEALQEKFGEIIY